MSFDHSLLMSQQLCLSIISTEHRASSFSPGVVFITSNESLHPASQSNKTKLICDMWRRLPGHGRLCWQTLLSPRRIGPLVVRGGPLISEKILSLPSCEGATCRVATGLVRCRLLAPRICNLVSSIQTRARTKTDASRSIRTRSLHDATFCREISQTSIYQVAIVSSAAA